MSAAVVPDGILSVGEAAFYSTKVSYLTIPDSVRAVHRNQSLATDGIIDFGNTRTNIPSVVGGYNPQYGGAGQIYVPDALYDNWVSNHGWSIISARIHRHSELEAPYATSKAEDAYSMADNAYSGLTLKVDHTAGGDAPEVLNITTYYETEYTQLSVDDPSWEPDPSTMYVILPDPVSP